MAEISVPLSPLLSRDTPMAEERSTTCEVEQALLSGSLVFVKLDFNETAESTLFIGGV